MPKVSEYQKFSHNLAKEHDFKFFNGDPCKKCKTKLKITSSCSCAACASVRYEKEKAQRKKAQELIDSKKDKLVCRPWC